MQPVRLDPFFSYYGAAFMKCRKGFYPAPRPNDLVVERFAGSAAYACTFAAGRSALIVDLDEHICGIWSYLIRVSEREIMSLPETFEGSVRDLSIPQEARWLIGFWLGRAMSAPTNKPVRWMREMDRQRSHQSCFWGPRPKARIARQLPAIRKWRVVQGSYQSAVFDPRTTTVFDDPPYRGTPEKPLTKAPGRHYRKRPRTEDWYQELCMDQDSIAAAGARVIVCEHLGAVWRPDFHSCGSVKALEGTNGKKRSHEVAAVLDYGSLR
jgi:hypothetical protein